MHEKLRKRYRPENVRVLFIGESPPSSGKFFYKGNSILLNCTIEAFKEVFDNGFTNNEVFLDYFKDNNYYLDDLCIVPVNNLCDCCRAKICKHSIPLLAQRIKKANPDYIIIFIKRIKEYVEKAIKKSGLNDSVMLYDPLPFPYGENNQKNYKDGLIEILEKIEDER